jgi:hypothetical protein
VRLDTLPITSLMFGQRASARVAVDFLIPPSLAGERPGTLRNNVVLKALAFKNRGENKDAYDLVYLLRHFGKGVDDVVPAPG